MHRCSWLGAVQCARTSGTDLRLPQGWWVNAATGGSAYGFYILSDPLRRVDLFDVDAARDILRLSRPIGSQGPARASIGFRVSVGSDRGCEKVTKCLQV